MTSEDLRKIIAQPEGLKLDFKREVHLNTTPPDGTEKQMWATFVKGRWDEFIKDILALTNGNSGTATQEGRLIIGVDDKLQPDGSRELHDTSYIGLTDKLILQKVNGVCTPPIPQINCERISLDGKSILIITIPPTPHLHETTRQLNTTTGEFNNDTLIFSKPNKTYTEGTAFVRRGEEIGPATAEERKVLEKEKSKIYHSPGKVTTAWRKVALQETVIVKSVLAIISVFVLVSFGLEFYAGGSDNNQSSPKVLSNSTLSSSNPVTTSFWLKSTISPIDYLPPIHDLLGDPDFILKVTDDHRLIFQSEVFFDKEVTAKPFSLQGIKKLYVELVEDDQPLGEEKISNVVSLSVDDFLSGGKIKLSIMSKVFDSYPNLDQSKREITFDFNVSAFDPEGNSGIDAFKESAFELKPGNLVVNSVSFNDGDATDYVKVPRDSDRKQIAIFWGKTLSQKNAIEILEGRDNTKVTKLLDRVQKDLKNEKEVIAVIASTANEMTLFRIQAERPNVYTEYVLFLFSSESDEKSNFLDFFTAWLANEYQMYKQESNSVFKHRLTNESKLGLGIKNLRNHFGISVLDIIAGIEKINETDSDAYIYFALQIIEPEILAYADLKNKQHKISDLTSQIIAVLSAEKGLYFDSIALGEVLKSSNKEFVERAYKAIKKSGGN